MGTTGLVGSSARKLDEVLSCEAQQTQLAIKNMSGEPENERVLYGYKDRCADFCRIGTAGVSIAENRLICEG